MRLLLLLTGAFQVLGGIHTFNRAFIKALDDLSREHDLQVRVHSLLDLPEGGPEATAYLDSGNIIFRGYNGDRYRFSMEAVLASRSQDAVILGHVNLTSLSPVLKPKRKLLVVHGVEVWRRLSRWQRLGLSGIQEILSVSAYTEHRMVEMNGMPPARFSVFPNTLDPSYPARSTASGSTVRLPSGKILLTVTRMHPAERYKRVDLVIQSLPAILRATPDVYYVVIGDGPERAFLQELAQRCGVSDHVIFPGRAPDSELAAYYAACDLYVMPSLKEGFGIAFLEAMYQQKACIGARAGGIPEVIEDGVTGLLAEPDDPASFTDHALRLLSDSGERVRMGKLGRERLDQQFAFPAFRERLQRILF